MCVDTEHFCWEEAAVLY